MFNVTIGFNFDAIFKINSMENHVFDSMADSFPCTRHKNGSSQCGSISTPANEANFPSELRRVLIMRGYPRKLTPLRKVI